MINSNIIYEEMVWEGEMLKVDWTKVSRHSEVDDQMLEWRDDNKFSRSRNDVETYHGFLRDGSSGYLYIFVLAESSCSNRPY